MSAPTSQPYRAKISRPLPIRWWTRLADARDARRCARSTPPRPEAQDGEPSTTRIEAIRHGARDAAEAERLAYLGDTRADRILLAALLSEQEAAVAALRSATQDCDALTAPPVTDERRAGEHHLPATSIARRRAAERQRSLASAINRVRTAQADLDRTQQEAAETRQRIGERLAAAKSRTLRLMERHAVRIDHYRSALVAAHPEGAELNRRFTTPSVEVPTWVSATGNVDLGASTWMA